MGVGIHTTYPKGILKSQKSVSFGKPEVRIVHQDRWATTPLVDYYRQEMKIRRAPIVDKPRTVERPLPPKPPVISLPKRRSYMGRKIATAVITVLATGVLCGLFGPFGLIPAAVVVGGFAILGIARVVERNYQRYLQDCSTLQHYKAMVFHYQTIGDYINAEKYYKMAAQLAHRMTK